MDIRAWADELGVESGQMQRLVLTFVEATEQDLISLDEAVSEGDADKLRISAHQIRGAASNLELREIAKAALEIEKRARAGNVAEAATHIGRIRSHLDAVRSQFAPSG